MGYIAILGGLLSAVGQAKAGQDAKAVFEYNQRLAKYRGDQARDRADIETAALERDVSSFISRQRVIAGSSGGVVDEGSNLDSILKTRREAAIDASLIRYNADIVSTAARNESNLLGAQGSNIQTAGYINAGSTLLGQASKWDWKRSQLRTYTPPDRFGYRPGV